MRFSGPCALLLCVAAASCSRAQTPAPAASAPAAPAPALSAPTPSSASAAPSPTALEDVEERQGPFTSGNDMFTVVLHSKRLPGRTDADSQSLASLEIRDASGRVAHRQEFAHPVENGAFAESCSAQARQLAGSMGRGILITTECLPSAPLGGGAWAVFGVVRGALTRFGKPLVTDGMVGDLIPGTVTRRGAVTQTLADMLRVRMWTGYFFVTFPVRIDWVNGALAPGQRCLEQTGRGFEEGGCEMAVEEARPSPREQQTFVRLFRDSNESSGPPAHVVVNTASTVEIVAGKVRVIWTDGPDALTLSPGDDLWVRVKIDGRDGWIHTDEDLQAVGLFQAG